MSCARNLLLTLRRDWFVQAISLKPSLFIGTLALGGALCCFMGSRPGMVSVWP